MALLAPVLPLLSTQAPIPWIQLTLTWDLVLSPLTVKSTLLGT